MLKKLRLSGLAAAMFMLSTHLLSAQATANIAMQFLQQEMLEQNWSEKNIATLRLKSQHRSSVSGLNHYYFQQESKGIPVLPGWASVHLNDQGNVAHWNNQLIGNLSNKLPKAVPSLSAAKVLEAAMSLLLDGQKVAIKSNGEKGQTKILTYESHDSLTVTVPANLVYQIDKKGDLHLCWDLLIPVNDDVWNICADANTGQEISRHNWVHHCQFTKDGGSGHCETKHCPKSASKEFTDTYPSPVSTSNLSFDGKYRVFPIPIESPLYGMRSLTNGADIIDAFASPNGWHDIDGASPSPDYGYTRGNNVYAYYAPLLSFSYDPTPKAIKRILGLYASGNVPWPNDLVFDYNHNLNSLNGTDFIEDAVTNLFVWNNICHDVFYRYGFDEAAGNFQAKNFTNLGVEGDYVRARAQDGSGVNNAAFFTPPEPPPAGSNPPYMRMFLWDSNFPSSMLDGDFDNAIIAHEYGHGVSNRLVGGAFTNSCLTNFEQGGEGWSDFFGLLFTMNDHDNSGTIEKTVLGEGIRSIGTYVLGHPANGSGVRPAHYSSIMDCSASNCNDFTYGDVPNMALPHGVGFVWCTMLWDMTLDLIEANGFEENIYTITTDPAQHKGNTRAMNLVIEGLKLTPCNPTFPQMRDAILAADTAIYSGANSQLIWAAFARRGLGYSATAGGNEAFDDPTMLVTKTVDKAQIEIGDHLTYTITVKNNSSTPLTNVDISDPIPANLNVTSVSDGGSVQNGEVTFPQILEIPVGQSVSRTFSAEVVGTEFTVTEYDNPIEATFQPDFIPAGLWLIDGGNPHAGSTQSWWHVAPPIAIDASLLLTLNLDGSKNNHLSFWHYYDLEPAIDGAVIEILEGLNWVDLDSKIKQNGYNNIILDQLNTPIGVPIKFTPLSGRRAFSGYSGGYVETIVDLSGYSGITIIRFRIATDEGSIADNCDGTIAGCDGWYLDDFKLYDLENIQNTAYATSAQGFFASGDVGSIGTIAFEEGAMPAPLFFSETEPIGESIAAQIISENQNFIVYPNPVNGNQFYIEFSKETEESIKMQLWNAQGQLATEVEIPPQEKIYLFNKNNLPEGVYFLTTNINGHLFQQKIIFQ